MADTAIMYFIELRDAAGTLVGYVDLHSRRARVVASLDDATHFFDADDADTLIDSDAVKALAGAHRVGVVAHEVEC